MRARLLTIAIALFAGTLVSSCKKDYEGIAPGPGAGASIERAEALDVTGRYSVSRFVDSGVDKTKRFTKLRVVLAEDNVLYVTGPGINHKGQWTMDMFTKKMKITVIGDQLTEQLNGTWTINVMTPYAIDLKSDDVPGGKFLNLAKPRMIKSSEIPIGI